MSLIDLIIGLKYFHVKLLLSYYQTLHLGTVALLPQASIFRLLFVLTIFIDFISTFLILALVFHSLSLYFYFLYLIQLFIVNALIFGCLSDFQVSYALILYLLCVFDSDLRFFLYINYRFLFIFFRSHYNLFLFALIVVERPVIYH